jgi:hypothetical protein
VSVLAGDEEVAASGDGRGVWVGWGGSMIEPRERHRELQSEEEPHPSESVQSGFAPSARAACIRVLCQRPHRHWAVIALRA